MTESRIELLKWINELCKLDYKKIEQAGTGDVPLNRVKFEAKSDPEYLNNFKILQSVIPVDKLIKLKMQDNLEFVQWLKKYWNENYQGQYDALARRKSSSQQRNPNSKPIVKSVNKAAPVKPASKILSSSKPTNNVDLKLKKELEDSKETVKHLESELNTALQEREFYFNKLRSIEILIQTIIDDLPEKKGDALIMDIQNILYSTEEGFEAPNNNDLMNMDKEDDNEVF